MRFLKVFSATLLGLLASTANADVLRSNNGSLKVILNAGSTPTEVGDFTISGLSMIAVDTKADSLVLNSDAAESGVDWKATIQRGTQAANATFTLPGATDTLIGSAASQSLTNKTLGVGNSLTSNLTVSNGILIDGVDISVFKGAYDTHAGDSSDPHGAAMSLSTGLTTPRIDSTGNITIDMVNAGATTLSVTNSGAGTGSLSVQGNITVGGTVGGVNMTTVANHLSDTTDPHGASMTMSGTLGVSTINEYTLNAGVTIDGVLVKDSRIGSGYIRSAILNAAVYFDASGDLTASSTVSSTELGYLAAVTGDIQAQLNGKINDPGTVTSTAIVKWNGTDGTAVSNSGVLIDASNNMTGVANLGVSTINTNISSTELGYLDGLTGGIQGQLNGKINDPGTVTSTAIVKWNGTDGTAVSNSGVLIDASNNMTGIASLTATTIVSNSVDGVDVSVLNTNYTNHAADSSDPHGASMTLSGDLNANTYEGGVITSAEFQTLSDISTGSTIQTQINGKQATITGGATSITSSNLTASRALVSDASGKVAVSAVTSTELGYLDGVLGPLQGQLNKRLEHRAGVDNLYWWYTSFISTTAVGAGTAVVGFGFTWSAAAPQCWCQQGDVNTVAKVYAATSSTTQVSCYYENGNGANERFNALCIGPY